MADGSFDRTRFSARLATRRLGRTLLVRAETGSSNDEAWQALAAGLPDGVVVIAESQTAGRGRAGRTWTHAPGRSLAMSAALHLGCDVRQAGVIPLAAGLAVARAARTFAVPAALKWPNDVLAGGRKLAGVLCELRRLPEGGDGVVIGIGVNVGHQPGDFAPGLQERATSLALSGAPGAAIEDVAAAVLNELEPLWDELQEGDRARILADWTAHADAWGARVTVRTPAGSVEGIARRLEDDGALVLRLDSGAETIVRAGDLEAAGAERA